ncbi:MAG: hypothetical protein ACI8XB_002984 [Patiriisocius sp.]
MALFLLSENTDYHHSEYTPDVFLDKSSSGKKKYVPASETANVTVYPNPASDYLTVEMDNLKDAILTLTDVGGKNVNTTICRGDYQEIVDTRSLTPGHYIITIATAEGENISDKIEIIK